MATETKTDLDRSLDEVRREVIESRNLVIKTDNLLKNLHAELKAVSKRQEDFQKRTWISSAAAYVGFAALAAGAAVMVSNSRTQAVQADRERIERQLTETTTAAEKQRTEVQAAQTAERAAGEVYRLMTSGTAEERLKGIDAMSRLDPTKTPAFVMKVLQDRAQLLRKEVSGAALERGKAAFRRQEWEKTVEELKRVITVNPSDEDALEASYFLGNALVQQRKNEEAIPHLTRYVEGDKRAKTRDFAMLLLVQAYDAIGQRDKAVEVAREAASTYPNSEFGQGFRNRLLRKDTPSGGGGGGAQGAAPAAGAGAQPQGAQKTAPAPAPAQPAPAPPSTAPKAPNR
jgi:tetratricopeptide (TPR) repeat protein